MMTILPSTDFFSLPGRFWRGNLHTHSNRSDGVLEPEDVCRRYAAEGYDFISLTDHHVGLYDYPITDTRSFRCDGFTTLLGAELHSGAMENGEIWHILAVGLPLDFQPANAPDFITRREQESGPEIAARAAASGAFVVVAHPEWSGMSHTDALSINSAHAIEVYNHSCAISADRPHGFSTLDRLLEVGCRRTLCATDDAHFEPSDHFGGWVMVKAEENSPEALLAALKAGHMYSSTGPELRGIHWQGTQVIVECSAVERVIVLGAGSAVATVHGQSMTRAVVPLDHFAESPFMRVCVIDRAGGRAWSNPVYRQL